MSSKNPNLQNIPVRPESKGDIRKAFVARDKYSIVSLDYSQIEFKLAGILADDKGLLKILNEGGDVHTRVANKMFGKKDISKDERNKAKAITYGILYGMGVSALQKNLTRNSEDKVTREESQKTL